MKKMLKNVKKLNNSGGMMLNKVLKTQFNPDSSGKSRLISGKRKKSKNLGMGLKFRLQGILIFAFCLLPFAFPNMAFAQGAGKALDFDGDNDYVFVQDAESLDITSTITIEAWVRPNTAYMSTYILNKWNAYAICIMSTTPAGDEHYMVFYIWADNPMVGLQQAGTLTPNNWYHIVVTYDKDVVSNNHKLYINGVLDNQRTTTGPIDASAANLYIGTLMGMSGFNGTIDEVRIWNVARTEAQIQEWMHKTEGLNDETGLVSVWHLNESTVGSGSAIDSKGSNNGTPTNMENGDCVTSTAPFGIKGSFVATQTQTDVGPSGGQIKTTITSTPSDANNLGVYQFGSLSGDPVTSGETFPGTFNKRSNIVWGVSERGAVTANLVFDYSNQPGVSDASKIEILKRDNADDTVWVEVTESSRDDENKTITLTGVTSFSEFALGAGADNSLPVVLSTFTAQFLNGVPTLYWKTMSETDNLGWFIYRNAEEDFTTSERITDYLIEGYGTTTEPHHYIYEDVELDGIQGETYWYWIESVDLGGAFHRYEPEIVIIQGTPEHHETPEIPKQYGLHQNKPNPLYIGRGSTKISFLLHNTARAEIKIYNIRGELVKDLYKGIAYGDDEVKDIIWDGRNENGVEQNTGIYLYQLKVNGKVYETKRLIVIR